MRAFKFRLQTLQRLREQARDMAQRDLAEARLKQATLAHQMKQAHSQLHELETHMRSAVSRKQVDVDRVMDGHRHQISLQARLAELDKVMIEAGEELDRCRKKLVQTDREVKVLEKLHQRQLAEHNHHVAQQEIKQLDEVASVRAAMQTK